MASAGITDDPLAGLENRSDGGLSEKILWFVSKQLSTNWKDLGRELGIPESELNYIQAYNRDEGTKEMAYQMLLKWKEKTGHSGTLDVLVNHLRDIERNDIADALHSFSTEEANNSAKLPTVKAKANNTSMRCEEWEAELKERLQNEYLDLEMKGLPWMEDLTLTLDEYYVDLSLIKMDKRGKELPSEHMTINDIFDAVDGIPKPSRILVEGGPGLGKSTFAAKLAYDWAKGKSYISHFDLVILIPLRHFQGKLEQIISNAASIEKKHLPYLFQLLKNKSKHILILMDGYDEISPGIDAAIQPLLQKNTYSHTTVVVTSRTGMFTSIKSEGNEAKFSGSADVATGYYSFIQKRISIKGFNTEQQTRFVDIHTQSFSEKERQNIVAKLEQMVDKEFMKCPLFLLLLIVVFSEIPDTNTVTTSRTELYKHVFNCIIRRYYHKLNEPSVSNMDLFPINIEFSDNGKPSYIDLMLQFSEFSLWSLREKRFVFSLEDITQIFNGNSKLLELGILKQSVTVARLRQKLLYEPVHRSLLEFGAAYGLCMAFTQHSCIDNNLSKNMSLITPNISDSRLCFSFLLGLLEKRVDSLFTALLPYKSLYSSFPELFLPCLSEIQSTPSVLQSLSPYLPLVWHNKWAFMANGSCFSDKYVEILRCGLQEGNIKQVVWAAPEQACIPSGTEIGILLFGVAGNLNTDYIQTVVQKYTQSRIMCKSLCCDFQELQCSGENISGLMQILKIIEYKHLDFHFRDRMLPYIQQSVMDGILHCKTIQRVELRLCVLELELVAKINTLVKSKNVEKLEIFVDKLDAKQIKPSEILFSLAASAPSLRSFTFLNPSGVSTFNVDLANLCDGRREIWDGVMLGGIKVNCTKEVERELNIDYLNMVGCDVSERPTKLLRHCRVLSLSCPATLLRHHRTCWPMNESLSELNIIVDASVAHGISVLMSHFRKLSVLILTMDVNSSLSVPFETWLFGSNDVISLSGLEIWSFWVNPVLAGYLLRGISRCIKQRKGMMNSNLKLELQYLLIDYFLTPAFEGIPDFVPQKQETYVEFIQEPKSSLISGDLPRLDIIIPTARLTSLHLGIVLQPVLLQLLAYYVFPMYELFPIEKGFKIDCDLCGANDDDSIYRKTNAESFPGYAQKYSITFDEPTRA